jgi:hypothetical protein
MAAKLNNKKVQIAVICLLAIVVVYNAVHFLGKKTRRRNFVYENSEFEDGVRQTAIPAWAAGEYERARTWGTNPFTGKRVGPPAAAVAAGTTPLIAEPVPRSDGANITGIMISGSNKYVLAGDVLLREGDRLGAGRIITINRNSVIVEYETGTRTIYID